MENKDNGFNKKIVLKHFYKNEQSFAIYIESTKNTATVGAKQKQVKFVSSAFYLDKALNENETFHSKHDHTSLPAAHV